MGSLIHIDSISIDLADSIDKSDAGKCDHFSIRGYVSEIRKKDWKICWPFPLQGKQSESEDQPSLLPSLDVPKLRQWCCQTCRQEIAAEGSDKDNQSRFHCCSTGCRSASNYFSKATLRSDIQLQLSPTPDTVERREIDLNSSTNLSCGNDCLPTNNEKEKKGEVANNRKIDHETDVEGNLNHQTTSVLPPEVYPGLIMETPTNDRGFEGNEVSDVELALSNLKCMDQNSYEIYSGGTCISGHGQCQKELDKTCSVLEVGKVAAVADHTTDHTTTHTPIESVASQKALPGIVENLVKNDIQDHHHHHLENSSGLPRRKPRKVRLLTDLLSENVETKTENFTAQGFPSDETSELSAPLQTMPISQCKSDVEGDLTNMDKNIKKKLLQDEELKPAEISSHRFDSEVQNLEGDAEVNDTILDTGFKDVQSTIGIQEAVKSYWSKSETERNLNMGKKKKKKMQIVDSHLRSYSYQNEENIHVVSKGYASKTCSLRLPSCAFLEKGKDSVPLHALKLGKDCNLSKKKGNMPQADGDLASLSCWKNGKLVEDSFPVKGAKFMSNMPVIVPIPPAQGSIMNEKGVNEGLHLSLNSCLAAQSYNQKCIHQNENQPIIHQNENQPIYQGENQPPFSLPSLKGTSKVHQLIKEGRETNVVGEPSIPYKHIIDAISDKGISCEEITGVRKTQKPAEALGHVGIMKNNVDQKADKISEQGTLDDIPMEIVELMAKNQHERRLSEAENRSQQLKRSTNRMETQMTADTVVYAKGESILLQEGQKVKPEGRHGENGMSMRGENARPCKGKSVHYFSPIDGNHLNMNSLCEPQSSCQFEVSNSQKRPPNGFYFSPMVSSQFGSAPNCKLNGRTTGSGSSDSTLQVQEGCRLHKTILHKDDKATHIWASLTPNHLSLGCDIDVPKMVVSHSTSTVMDRTSPQTVTLHKQNINRDIDLNCLNLNATGLEKLNRNKGSGTISGINAEFPFPCKHNGIEPQESMMGSLDLYSNETVPAMHLLSLMNAGMKSVKPINACVSAQMLNKPSYPGDCNNKLEIAKALSSLKQPSSDYYKKNYLSDKSQGSFLSSPTLGASSSIQHNEKFIKAGSLNNQMSSKSGMKEKIKSSNSVTQNRVNKQFSMPYVETETPLQCKLEVRVSCANLVPSKKSNVSNSCSINRNPAEFTLLDMGNVYMIRGEDLKFEKPSIPKKRPNLFTFQGYEQQRNLKRTKIKNHAEQ